MSESLSTAGPCIVVKGLTLNGQVFRPSDWAQRLALAAAAGRCFAEQQPCYIPEVRVVTFDGVPAVSIDRRLEQSDPITFSYLMEFARMHELQCGGGV